MDGATPDVDGGYLSQCKGCDLFLAANADEEERVWGKVLHVRCSGRVMA